MPKAILLDIEGTTSPISFVTDTLFPYALRHMRDFVSKHHPGTLGRTIEILYFEREHETDPSAPNWRNPRDVDGAIGYLEWLMSKDRKSTALKEIQGRIWERGFADRELQGEVFSDVPEALSRWTEVGKEVYIFSSGSVLAQRNVFKYSNFGDLGKYLSGYFDTETGPKRVAASYEKIAKTTKLVPEEFLFISDIPEELTAAREAGMDVRLSVRPGNKPVDSEEFVRIESFDFPL